MCCSSTQCFSMWGHMLTLNIIPSGRMFLRLAHWKAGISALGGYSLSSTSVTIAGTIVCFNSCVYTTILTHFWLHFNWTVSGLTFQPTSEGGFISKYETGSGLELSSGSSYLLVVFAPLWCKDEVISFGNAVSPHLVLQGTDGEVLGRIPLALRP